MIVKPEVPEAIDVAFVDPDVMKEFADISDEGDSLSAEIQKDMVEGFDEVGASQELVV